MTNTFTRKFLPITAALSLAALSLALSPAPLFAQAGACNSATVPICSIGVGTVDVQITPQAVPTSTTVVAAKDAYIKSVTVANTTSGALMVSLCDRQTTPVCALTAVSIGANTTYIVTWPTLYWAPGGFTVIASSTGLVFYARFAQ